MSKYIHHTIQDNICTLTLNRPEKHNALNDQMISELSNFFESANKNEKIRVILMTAEGRNFCAGADLNWMSRMASASREENEKDALQLANLLHIQSTLSKPIIALVHGRSMGGGIGLIACCDIVIVSETASFCFSEVKLGLIPAVISPYVLRSIGYSTARRYFLSAEIFDATEAHRIGLAHQVVSGNQLLTVGQDIAKKIIENEPHAMSMAKKLLNELSPIELTIREKTVDWLAKIRASKECKEKIAAFLMQKNK